MKNLSKWLRLAGVLTLMSGIFVCLAWVCTGRMTGGGSVFQGPKEIDSAILDGTGRVTHGFELHCGCENGTALGTPPPLPNNLEINWGTPGDKHKFHLDVLASADCFYDPSVGSPNPPPAGFNTMFGMGTGFLDNDKAASTIYFSLTDAGEPGGTNGAPPPDTAAYLITGPSGVVLNVPATALAFGNHQAHADN